MLRPVFVHEVIDVLVVAGHRPEHRRGGQALLLGIVEDALGVHHIAHMLPFGALDAQIRALVVDDAVLFGIDARHHRGMAGVGDGRVDRANAIHARGALPDRRNCIQLRKNLQILIHHRVHGHDDYMPVVHH